VTELVSYAVTALIILAAVGIIAGVGFPLLDRSTEAAEIDSARKNLEAMDDKIRQVASLQPGSASELRVSVREGRYEIWPAADTIQYIIETETSIVTPGSGTAELGPVYVTAEGDEPTVATMKINFSAINITGSNGTLSTGGYRVSFEKQPGGDEPRVEVSR